MKQIIVIKTDPSRYFWLKTILDSLQDYDKYPIYVINSYEYLFFPVIENINCDEFVFLHDSMEITDTSMFDICFEKYRDKNVAFIGYGSKSTSVYEPFAGSLGKYRMSDMKKLIKPDSITTKQEDNNFETYFLKTIKELDPNYEVLNEDWDVRDFRIENLNGRDNFVMITPYYTKYRFTQEGVSLDETIYR